MSLRSLHPVLALVGAVVLSVGMAGSAVAQEEAASPTPAADIATERKAEREAWKTERAAAREDRKAAREQHKTRRAELRAAWGEVKEDCSAELRAIRSNDELDRAARREALSEARSACKEMLAAARDEYTAATRGGASVAIDSLYTETASDGTGVVRTDLGIALPGSAPGEELGLWHYLIPARTDLPPHTHPGWQLARVVRGELEYTVVEGEGVLLRGDESEPMGPGTYVLATGDGVIENPDLVHQASNRTDGPVTLFSATLFEAGEPISTVIELPEG